jgi:hypothetical protein
VPGGIDHLGARPDQGAHVALGADLDETAILDGQPLASPWAWAWAGSAVRTSAFTRTRSATPLAGPLAGRAWVAGAATSAQTPAASNNRVKRRIDLSPQFIVPARGRLSGQSRRVLRD